MVRFLLGLFIILHGLVHMWYFTLSQQWVEFQPEMGWTGESWIFGNLLANSTSKAIVGALFVLAAIAFVVSGIAFIAATGWWRAALVASALFSSAVIVLFWDGSFQYVVQKGLLGLLINIGILIALVVAD